MTALLNFFSAVYITSGYCAYEWISYAICFPIEGSSSLVCVYCTLESFIAIKNFFTKAPMACIPFLFLYLSTTYFLAIVDGKLYSTCNFKNEMHLISLAKWIGSSKNKTKSNFQCQRIYSLCLIQMLAGPSCLDHAVAEVKVDGSVAICLS